MKKWKRLKCEVKTNPVNAEDLYSKRNFLLFQGYTITYGNVHDDQF